MRDFLRINIFWALTAFIGGTLVGPLIAIGGVAPDFPLIALVFLGLAAGSYPATVAGFLAGLILDLGDPALLGAHALLYSCLGYVLGRLRDRLAYGMPVVEAVVAVAVVLAHDLGFLVLSGMSGAETFPLQFFTRSAPDALYTGLAAVPVMRLATWLGLLYRED